MAKELGIGVLVRIVDPNNRTRTEFRHLVGQCGRITEQWHPGTWSQLSPGAGIKRMHYSMWQVGSVSESVMWPSENLEPLGFEAGDMDVVRDLMKPCEVETA